MAFENLWGLHHSPRNLSDIDCSTAANDPQTICVVLGPKKSSMYSSEYTSGFSWPAASHLAAPPSPRYESNVGQAPRDQVFRSQAVQDSHTGKIICGKSGS